MAIGGSLLTVLNIVPQFGDSKQLLYRLHKIFYSLLVDDYQFLEFIQHIMFVKWREEKN